MTRVAFIGLMNSHPFMDARNLRELRPGSRFLLLSDGDGPAGEFLAEHPEAQRFSTLLDLVAARPDVALITMPPRLVPVLTKVLLDAGIPTVITKPAATSAAELELFEAAVAGRGDRVLTSSILRFAPELAQVPDGTQHVHVTVSHHIDYWLEGRSRWQDEAGGLVPMMGVHAFEILEQLLGPSLTVTGCTTSGRGRGDLASPYFARGTAVAGDALSATFEVDGAAEGQSYTVEWHEGRPHRLTLGDAGGGDPFGARAMMEHVLALADGGPSPLPWERTRAVLAAVAEASALADQPGGGT